MIFLDFETFSEVDLKKAGAFKYAEHPSTEILCMAYRLPGETETNLWLPSFEVPTALCELIGEGELVEAHNAGFEYLIWNMVGVQKNKFTSHLKIEQLRDTAAYAAAHAMPRDLKRLAKALDVDTQKDEKGHRIMLKLSKPRTPTAKNPSTRHEKFEDYEALYDYCITDVDAEIACSNKLPELMPFEQKLWELDLRINERGVYCDMDAVDNALKFIDLYKHDLVEDLNDLTDGYVTSASQVSRLLEWFNNNGLDIDNVKKETIDEIMEGDHDEHVLAVADIRQRLALASIKKFSAMKIRANNDGRLRGLFLYHAATTGRWGGRGVQPQNLTRGNIKDQDGLFEDILEGDYEWFKALYGNVNAALSSALRGCLCAPPGKDLLVADYAAIEARVVMWLAGDEAALEVFRKGIDIYKDLATDIYKIALSAVTSNQRQLGKQGILGLGFGMGKPKFIATCEGYNMNVSKALAEKTVDTYRTKYYKVKNLWYDLQRAVIKAIKNRGKLIKFRYFQIKVVDRWLYIRLPSGRKLAYFDPKIVRKEKFGSMQDCITFWAMDSMTNQWKLQETYGGKLVENVTQGVARDLMAHAMMNLEEAGYKIVMHVHDEIVAEVDEGKKSLEEFERIMATTPKWAKGLPVKAEGWRGKRYKK